MASVSFPSGIFDELFAHLNAAPEQMAFMRCRMTGSGEDFRVDDLLLIPPQLSGLEGENHVELQDAQRAEIIKWAWQSGSCLMEAHSHGAILLPAKMSRYDLAQLAEWVPHVRWRLGGRPYGALVTASRDIDGIAWINGSPESIDAILIDGR